MTATFVTFYSFKGGVGRSQALANTAVALANRGLRVIAVDMDLESPGLHVFFERESGGPIEPQAGVLEYLEASFALPEDPPQATRSLIPCTHVRRIPNAGSIRILLAGDLLRDYARRLSAFSWETFYRERDGYRFIELFRNQLGEASADFVLIDSRTGVNDVGQVCTFQLPDVVVALFALHSQGIEGTRKLAAAVRRCQDEEGEFGRPRRFLLVPARVDEAAPDELRERWLAEARRAFDGSHELLADLHERIPYTPQVAFGEHVVIGGAKSILSEAYERLVGRIIGGAGGDAVLRLDEIRGLLREVEQELRRGSGERPLPSSTSLRELRRWFSVESERREAILGRIDRARRSLEHLRSAGGPEGVDIGPVTRLDTDTDLDTEANRLAVAVHAIDQQTDDQRQRVRAGLLAAAENDEQLIEVPLASLYEAIDSGRWSEVDKQLAEFQESLSRKSWLALLRQGRLSVEQYRQSPPGIGDRVQWLDQMIERTLNDSTSNAADLAPMLKNLLVLARYDRVVPSLFHWMAYEQLCVGATDHRPLFTDIGDALWRAEWSRLLAEPTAVQIDMDYPVGIEGRTQIEVLARDNASLLAPIAMDIRDRLMALWSDGGRPRDHVYEVFRKRHTDPLLREGIHLVADAAVPVDVRCELLAAWLQTADRPEVDRRAVRGFLAALVERGHVGEAFYALNAFAQHDAALVADASLAFVWIAMLTSAARRGNGNWCRKLIASPDALSIVLATRIGLALVAGVASEQLVVPLDVAAMARTRLLHSDSAAAPLPSATLELLATLERGQRSDYARASAVAAREQAVEAIAERGIYGSWPPTAAWEAEFHELVMDALQDVLSSRDRRAAAAVVARLDSDAWVRRTHERLRHKRVRTGLPDGPALKAIERNFADVRHVLSELAQSMPEDGGSLLDEMHSVRLVRGAMTELVAWLAAFPPEGPLDAALSADVRAQLEGALR